ncbi:VOC family protein [Streptosporangium sandarakinum]
MSAGSRLQAFLADIGPEPVGTRVACFNDPDGANLEVIQPKGGFARRRSGPRHPPCPVAIIRPGGAGEGLR